MFFDQRALIGLIETWRNYAVALRLTGRPQDAEEVIGNAINLAEAGGVWRPILQGRLYRTRAIITADNKLVTQSLEDSELAFDAFEHALPGTKPLAETLLVWAGELTQLGRNSTALPLCRAAINVQATLRTYAKSELIEPCLEAYAIQADQQSDQHQPLLQEMFAASQFIKSPIAARQIAQATARLMANPSDPALAGAMRKMQDMDVDIASSF